MRSSHRAGDPRSSESNSSGRDERTRASSACDRAVAHQARQRVLERDHSLALAERDLGGEVLQLVVADVIAHGVVRQQHFHGHGAALVVRARDQLLHDDGVEAERELLLDLRLLRGGEDVDDAVDRLRGVARVQRGEDEVAGLRGGERGGDGLEVAHLADQDHVGILTQRRAQRRRRTTARRVRSPPAR